MKWAWRSMFDGCRSTPILGLVSGLTLALAALVVVLLRAHPVEQGCEVACLFPTGALPRTVRGVRPMAFDRTDELVIFGTVADEAGAEIGLRIDDWRSSDYASRYNDERKLPRGPFRFTIGLSGLRASNGRVLEHGEIRLIKIFTLDDKANVALSQFFVRPAARLPDGAIGYALGAMDAPLPSGFERIGPRDLRITPDGAATAVRRPAPDPLVANGVVGIKRLQLTAPVGPARVSIWSEDPGEWEDLPRPVQRRIIVNGKELLSRSIEPQAWISSRYLRGRTQEQSVEDDAWSAFGRLRGDVLSVDIVVGDDGVEVALSGAERVDGLLNAVLIEPLRSPTGASETAARRAVDETRADWYRSHFPVLPQNSGEVAGGEPVTVSMASNMPNNNNVIKRRAAADTGIGIQLDVTSDADVERPQVSVEFGPGDEGLRGQVWSAAWRLERSGTTLQRANNHLVAEAERLPLRANVKRSYEIWVDIPKHQPPGIYRGSFAIGDGAHRTLVPIEIEVLPVALPVASKPAGFYLARAPHLAGYEGASRDQDRQVGCDLDYMRRLGLTNTAPPIGGLEAASPDRALEDASRANRYHVGNPWLAYNPLHDLMLKFEPEQGAEMVAGFADRMRQADLIPPLWSVADEPSNPDQDSRKLTAWIKALRARAKGIRIAGHLNARSDQALVPLFDTILINEGFGIDREQIKQQRDRGIGVWIYNTGAPRVTAGLWLLLTDAERYIQWHARMPTADPFDPLDGREGDFQMFDPMPEVCAPHPDIHRNLLRMAEGIVDQRWLAWLERQTSGEASELQARLRTIGSRRFQQARDLTQSELDRIREQIMDLVAAQGQVRTTVGSGG